jgi:hypothetical protein
LFTQPQIKRAYLRKPFVDFDIIKHTISGLLFYQKEMMMCMCVVYFHLLCKINACQPDGKIFFALPYIKFYRFVTGLLLIFAAKNINQTTHCYEKTIVCSTVIKQFYFTGAG